MNAWTLPSVIAPAATRSPPTTAIATYVKFPMNWIAGIDDDARHELRLEAGVEQLRVLGAKRRLDRGAPAEHLDQRVAGERLFDLAVERAEVLPLRGEALLRALADPGS